MLLPWPVSSPASVRPRIHRPSTNRPSSTVASSTIGQLWPQRRTADAFARLLNGAELKLEQVVPIEDSLFSVWEGTRAF